MRKPNIFNVFTKTFIAFFLVGFILNLVGLGKYANFIYIISAMILGSGLREYYLDMREYKSQKDIS